MTVRSTALAAAVAFASVCAEAVSVQMLSEGTMRVEYMKRREHEHRRSIKRLESNMTTTSALDIVLNKSASKPELQSFIQMSMRAKKSNLRATQLEASDSKAHYDGLEKAKDMLNEMIEESQTKYDLEIEQCCEYDAYAKKQEGIILEKIAKFNAEAADARACVLDQNGIIELCETELPSLTDQLEAHNDECAKNTGELRRLLKIVDNDIDIMAAILKIIGTCPDEGTTTAAPGGLFLMERCMAQGEDGSEDGCSYIQFQDNAVQSALSQLKSDDAKELVQDNLQELHERELEDDDAQTDSTTTTAPESTNTTTTWVPLTVPSRQLTRGGPCKEPKVADKKTSKCTPSAPNCLKMKEKFEYIKAGMEDKKADLEEQLSKLEAHCEKEKINFEDQISTFEKKLKDAQNKLAICTSDAIYNEQQSELAGGERKDLLDDYAKMTKKCHKNYEAYESDICGVKKIRTELYKVKGSSSSMKVVFFQDCVVGDWVPGECSESCGEFGMVQLTRTIMTKPVGGAKCPVLTAEETCNRVKCPIDCKLDVWSGWSACTSKCGGGVTERQRDIVVEPQHNGLPCGETAESTSCNIQACNKDCVLGDWTAWTPCTKQCNGGHLLHFRYIKEQAIGNGYCPPWWSYPTRIAWTTCNAFQCKAGRGCGSRLDVVLVIDGSGSLGPYGWSQTRKAGALLTRAFGKAGNKIVMISVILFSYYATVTQHFTHEIEATAKKIEELSWPRSLTYTSKALNLAKDELQMGRQDADAVVIVITDGRPMSFRNTRMAAKRLRKEARLMFVPVTKYAPMWGIKTWASFPRDENIIQVNWFYYLDSLRVADAVISDACKELV